MTIVLQIVPLLLVTLLLASGAWLLHAVRAGERTERELVDRQRQRFESDFKSLMRRLDAAASAALNTPALEPPRPPDGEGEGRREPRKKRRSKGRHPRRS